MPSELQNICESNTVVKTSSSRKSNVSNTSWFGGIFSSLCCRRMYIEFENEEISQADPELAANLEDMFKWLDDYDKGYVDCIDFRRMLREFGQYEMLDKTKRDMKSISGNRRGTMRYKKFNRLMMKNEKEETYDQIFRFVDKSNKGYIAQDDLKVLFKELHLKIDEENIEELLKEASNSNDMRVDKFEFLEAIK